jgi:hypothetical protein
MGVEEEEAFLKPLMPEAEQHMRMEPTVNSLLFAIQKNFRRGYEQYAKGEQDDFYAFFQRNYPGYVMFDTGRPGTGSRMDAAFEVAYAVAMNFEPFLNYLVHSSSISTEPAILSESIKNRLGSVEFYAPLICRARFWIKVFAPLRVLCNCHDLEGHGVHDMGAVLDTLEEAMHQLIEDPSLLRDPNFTVFTLQSWPCLKDYFFARLDKVKLEMRVVDLEKERLYGCRKGGCGDEVEALVDKLVVCIAKVNIHICHTTQVFHKFSM